MIEPNVQFFSGTEASSRAAPHVFAEDPRRHTEDPLTRRYDDLSSPEIRAADTALKVPDISCRESRLWNEMLDVRFLNPKPLASLLNQVSEQRDVFPADLRVRCGPIRVSNEHTSKQ